MDLIVPDWPAPAKVKSAQTTRHGGVSVGRYCCLNLGDHVGDSTAAVSKNRAWLRASLGLPSEPLWLNQVHGTQIVQVDGDATAELVRSGRQADGSHGGPAHAGDGGERGAALHRPADEVKAVLGVLAEGGNGGRPGFFAPHASTVSRVRGLVKALRRVKKEAAGRC